MKSDTGSQAKIHSDPKPKGRTKCMNICHSHQSAGHSRRLTIPMFSPHEGGYFVQRHKRSKCKFGSQFAVLGPSQGAPCNYEARSLHQESLCDSWNHCASKRASYSLADASACQEHSSRLSFYYPDRLQQQIGRASCRERV